MRHQARRRRTRRTSVSHPAYQLKQLQPSINGQITSFSDAGLMSHFLLLTPVTPSDDFLPMYSPLACSQTELTLRAVDRLTLIFVVFQALKSPRKNAVLSDTFQKWRILPGPQPLTLPLPRRVRLPPTDSSCKASLAGALGESGGLILHSQRMGPLRAAISQAQCDAVCSAV